MAFGSAPAVALLGVKGHPVEVQAHIAPGLPAFAIVGLPDASLVESRDRVRSAICNSGHALPARRITVNLAPAALPKAGTGFDLAVAAALLAAAGEVPPEAVAGCVHIGELALDGRVQSVPGVLPAVLAAVREGTPRVVVPHECAVEARLVPGAVVLPVTTLADVVALHRGEDYPDPPPVRSGPPAAAAAGGTGDLSEVYGQVVARRALEIAAAGGHHLLMLGPPGAGKTMLASRLPGLLPPLDEQQALEVTAVHSLAGTLDPAAGLVRWPPFESPHHTSTPAAIAGGGQGLPTPGAASRAHRGVLFLDEAAEFDPRALQALRQPLEDGELVIHRARGIARFPARFQLVLASNPCPCGLAVGRGIECLCTPMARRRYLARLSGPLLDRVDLQVEVLGVTRSDLHEPIPPESTAAVSARVRVARAAAQERLAGLTWTCNGQLPGSVLRGRFRLPGRVTRVLDQALDQGKLTLRGVDRVTRVAWTVADLQGRASPDASDIAVALGLRRLGPAPGMSARRHR